MKFTKEHGKLFFYLSIILVIIAIAGSIGFVYKPQFAYASTDLNQNVNVKDNLQDFSDTKYIPNKDYFIENPRHHPNNGFRESGVCTTVALQMLLGYHNYYSDRRLIPV